MSACQNGTDASTAQHKRRTGDMVWILMMFDVQNRRLNAETLTAMVRIYIFPRRVCTCIWYLQTN
jgi:hypothetical protein